VATIALPPPGRYDGPVATLLGSRFFHRPSCPLVARAKAGARHDLADSEAAGRAGLIRCALCFGIAARPLPDTTASAKIEGNGG
jgi:hypothetical protein